MLRRHGQTGTKFYMTWKNIRQRCENKNKKDFKNYGGRGINVCERWQKFENFYEDMFNSYKKHVKNNNYTSIDRISNDKDYCKDNCRWATRKEQNCNKRMHKLTKEKVYKIREESKNGVKGIELSKKYKVCRGVISEIINYKRNYKNI